MVLTNANNFIASKSILMKINLIISVTEYFLNLICFFLGKIINLVIKYVVVRTNRLIFVILGTQSKLSSFQSAITSFQKNVIIKIDIEKNDK